jgi:tetratricopeptide (TPR) repeat protein
MLLRSCILFSFILVYGLAFSILDHTFQNRDVHLQPALPAKIQQVASGYLSQITSEILFIKTSVFLGGVKPGTPATTYAEPLANNFEVMTSLYPEFIDPYLFNQSFLAPISQESAQRANAILNTGIKTFPNNFVLRFFYAFNYYSYLNEPLKAAKAFEDAATLPDAPPMFGHLAALFSAQGGNITAGLVMLQAMLAAEQNEVVRERYQQEIETFEKALTVEKAIFSYTKRYHSPPEKLEDLVPEYLKYLPEIQHNFILIYEPPILRLERP